jgi:hypothetical protein
VSPTYSHPRAMLHSRLFPPEFERSGIRLALLGDFALKLKGSSPKSVISFPPVVADEHSSDRWPQ